MEVFCGNHGGMTGFCSIVGRSGPDGGGAGLFGCCDQFFRLGEQFGPVFLERQRIVCTSIKDGLGGVRPTMQGIGGQWDCQEFRVWAGG